MREFIFYFFNVLGVLPLILYFLKGSRNKDYLKFLLPFIVLMFIASIYETIFTHILKIGSTPWFRIYSFLEFYTLLYFYWKLLNRKWLSLFFGIVYLLNYCHLIYEWVYFPSKSFNLISCDVITTSLVLVFTTVWLIEIFKKMEETSLHLNPLFYIIGAILLFYCSTFIMFILYDFMIAHKIKTAGLYIIIYYANLVLRGTFAIVYWKASRMKT